ncbi:RES domain-containing protein [Echinicola strongylocentroti]|uniref:RES domain-containing protein n=1 Tax=Echinicola strongylocentroti TaxID=1795355 RepID=A0A2Z4INY0_9BACT|nr:RES family NAD+ phosphorylase [Echinicola strongylocentroti]AWW32487.1 RES domain-containing protein [Echinicola strongylocentroti]
MLIYRIVNRKYAGDLSGTGAALFGGRWNKKGTPVLYTGENKEIALLETIVHTPPMLVPELDIVILKCPDNITSLSVEELPPNWKAYPAPTILAELGEKWVTKNKTVALKVPSCIIHSSHNFILNCQNPTYKEVKIIDRQPFHFDPRLTN